MNRAKPSLFSIEQLMQHYFDGLYYGDVKLLGQVFHPDAKYITATAGDLVQLSMDEYFDLVRHRTAPASQKQQRQDSVEAIELLGNNAALVKASCVIAPKHFSDRLSLINIDNQWQIISKIFHYEIDTNLEE